MATETRHSEEVKNAEVDILAGHGTDRMFLRGHAAFTPSRYLYEADGTTHVLNAMGKWAVEGVGDSYIFHFADDEFLTTYLGVGAQAGQAVHDHIAAGLSPVEAIDKGITEAWEKYKNDAFAQWDQMVAAHNADPENVAAPTVEALADAIGCTQISGSHPFIL